MSACMTSPKCFGNGTGDLEIFVLSIVATSPRLSTGSLSSLDKWKLGLKHSCRCGMMESVFLNPISFRSSSTLIVLSACATD